MIDGGMLSLVSTFFRGRSNVSWSEKQVVDRGLAQTWIASMLQMLRSVSRRIANSEFSPTPAWMDAQLKAFRRDLKIPSLFERRQPRKSVHKPVAQAVEASPSSKDSTHIDTQSTVAGKKTSAPMQQQVKAGMKRQKETAASTRETKRSKRASKKREDSTPLQRGSIFMQLIVQHHRGFTPILTALQSSPIKTPLKLKCEFAPKNPDDQKGQPTHNVQKKIECFLLHKLEGKTSQTVSYETTEGESFESLAAVVNAKSDQWSPESTSGLPLFEDENWKSFQQFSLLIPLVSENGTNELEMNLLDFLICHYWIQELGSSFTKSLPDTSISMRSVLFSSGKFALPSEIVRNVCANLDFYSQEYSPRNTTTPQPWIADRFTAAQIIFLCHFKQFVFNAISSVPISRPKITKFIVQNS